MFPCEITRKSVTEIIRLLFNPHDAFRTHRQSLLEQPETRIAEDTTNKSSIGQHIISGAQVRAARALLEWSVRDLALQAFVSTSIIEIIENVDELTDESRRQLKAIQATFEAAGIDFEDNSTASKRHRDHLRPRLEARRHRRKR